MPKEPARLARKRRMVDGTHDKKNQPGICQSMSEDFRTIERYEDMSPLGKLRLLQQADGDIIIAIIPDPEGIRHFAPSVEFCIPGSGGGNSPHTHKALFELMRAMALDNKERQQQRE